MFQTLIRSYKSSNTIKVKIEYNPTNLAAFIQDTRGHNITVRK